MQGIRYSYEFSVTAIDPTGASDTVRCLVLRGSSTLPSINALLKMPLTEPIPM